MAIGNETIHKLGFMFFTIELVCCFILCRKAILRDSDFRHGQACHDGEAVELARKATPSLQTHSSGRSVSLDMTIFLPFYI